MLTIRVLQAVSGGVDLGKWANHGECGLMHEMISCSSFDFVMFGRA